MRTARQIPWYLIASILISLSAIALANLFAPPLKEAGSYLALALVILIPGYLAVISLFPAAGDLDLNRRFLLSLGASLLLAGLISLILYFTPRGLQAASLATILSFLVLFLAALSYLRWSALPRNKRFVIGAKRSYRSRRTSGRTSSGFVSSRGPLLIALAAVLVLAGLALAFYHYQPGMNFLSSPKGYTDLEVTWPKSELGDSSEGQYTTLTAGRDLEAQARIDNHEGIPVNYSLRLAFDNSTIFVKGLRLADNETWESMLGFVLEGQPGQQRLDLLLFKEGDSTVPYKSEHLLVDLVDDQSEDQDEMENSTNESMASSDGLPVSFEEKTKVTVLSAGGGGSSVAQVSASAASSSSSAKSKPQSAATETEKKNATEMAEYPPPAKAAVETGAVTVPSAASKSEIKALPKASIIFEESPYPEEAESLSSSNSTNQAASNLSVLPENASGPENVSTINHPPVLQSLQSSMPSPQTKGTAIIWRAEAIDPDGDRILYRFLLNGEEMKNWSRSGSWSFLTHYLPAGEYIITVQAMDGLHSTSDSFDSSLNATMVILEQNQPPILRELESDPESPSPQGSLIGSPTESSAESSVSPLAISPEGPSKPADVPAGTSSTTSLNQIPMFAELTPDSISPLEIGAIINWTARAADPDGDELSYKFLLDGQDMTGWSSSPSWTWDTSDALPGIHRITVLARDGKHAPTDSFDDSIDAEFTLMDKNLPPVLSSLVPDLSSPRVLGETIVWKAEAMDPDNDPILYKFQLGGKDMIRWSESNSWSWSTRGLAADDYQITVLVRDGRHASEYSFDNSLAESFRLKTSIDQQIDLLMSQRGFNASGDTEYSSSDIMLKVADT
ncbi:MAG: DUF1616 domain-containing protein [Methanothrix soehngenii]|uniref:DUF1616 domain-containing protein n=1 Tax=Methanothrix soehngenii TaxID=2223 RepID=UPI0023F54A95|nr:DUF1616 domain-containing protein [Methanothrix soehngenii]MDD5257909.1 DUF1616 domain-containing protein [Methanothrix soehngenii]